MRTLIVLYLLCCLVHAQAPAESVYPLLEGAYSALEQREYYDAIRGFRKALDLEPGNAGVRKDLAYALLRIGETEAAREEFAIALDKNPADEHMALEYAYLCYETGREAEARRVFAGLRESADEEIRAKAKTAFENVDQPLVEGIARWKSAVEQDPKQFSAQRELARLAERRDDWKLAAEHYEAAWRLRPERRDLLLDLGRVWKALGDHERAAAALLAASRGSEPRTAEKAKELLPLRYPYVAEFEAGLALDPGNIELRRELAFLLIEMDRKQDAERHFAIIVEAAPDDLEAAAQLGFLRLEREDYNSAMPLLRRVLKSNDEPLKARVREALDLSSNRLRPVEKGEPTHEVDAREMARKSFAAGYMDDALKYLRAAHQSNPTDFEVMLELGKAHNMLRQDVEAIQWFDLARRSPDPAIAREAEASYRNLRPAKKRFRHTFWVMPFYSSRWSTAFGYGQYKAEVRFRNLPVRPYVSVRFAGDARRTTGSVSPVYLSESSFVVGVGLRTPSWNGLMGWVEAGSDVSYLDRSDRPSRMAPDYRGGAAFSLAEGSLLGGEGPGGFFETHENAVFMSRFDNTVLISTQNRGGYTAPVLDSLGGLETQFYLNGNLTGDARQQPWANFAEVGPGVRFRWKGMPRSLVFSVDLLYGYYLLGPNGGRTSYNDIRAGFWYAITR